MTIKELTKSKKCSMTAIVGILNRQGIAFAADHKDVSKRTFEYQI